MTVVGTSSQPDSRGRKLREALGAETGLKAAERFDLVACDMLQDEACFARVIQETKPDYVIHTAAPFIAEVDLRDEKVASQVASRTHKYHMATKLLAKSACAHHVRKVVMTGAATSVIGDHPRSEGTYHDSNEWASLKSVSRPNERAKLMAEKACWDEVLAWQGAHGSSATRLTTILPYFLTGPPLYREAFNSSCQAI